MNDEKPWDKCVKIRLKRAAGVNTSAKRDRKRSQGLQVPKDTFKSISICGCPSNSKFDNTIFEERSYFNGAIFGKNIEFDSAIFKDIAHFDNTVYNGNIKFNKAIFNKVAIFDNAKFRDSVYFKGTIFSDRLIFNNATVSNYTSFTNATFEERALFRDARFNRKATFNVVAKPDARGLRDGDDSLFNFFKAKFGGETDFRGRHFVNPPLFFDTELHEDTYFDDNIKRWPAAPKINRKAKANIKEDVEDSEKDPKKDNEDTTEDIKYDVDKHIRAYQRLALLMNLQEKREEWHFFNRLEMRARRVKEGHWSLYSLSNRFYQLFAGYGYSLLNTTAFWVGHMLLGAGLLSFPYLPYSGGDGLSWEVAGAAFTKSFINAHPFLLDLKAEDWADRVLCTQCGGEAVEVLQTVFGPIFLFFLFLTLRNRFRF